MLVLLFLNVIFIFLLLLPLLTLGAIIHIFLRIVSSLSLNNQSPFVVTIIFRPISVQRCQRPHMFSVHHPTCHSVHRQLTITHFFQRDVVGFDDNRTHSFHFSGLYPPPNFNPFGLVCHYIPSSSRFFSSSFFFPSRPVSSLLIIVACWHTDVESRILLTTPTPNVVTRSYGLFHYSFGSPIDTLSCPCPSSSSGFGAFRFGLTRYPSTVVSLLHLRLCLLYRSLRL
jgi:hypothetical protein